VNSHVIEFRSHCPKACLDVAQALPECQLSEGNHAEEISAFELFDLVVAAVLHHTPIEVVLRQMLNELREYRQTCVHPGLSHVGKARCYMKTQVENSYFHL